MQHNHIGFMIWLLLFTVNYEAWWIFLQIIEDGKASVNTICLNINCSRTINILILS